MYKSYKYKVEYKTFAGRPKDVKIDDFVGLQRFLGEIVMIIDYAYVYQKVKGQWEVIRYIDGKMFYPVIRMVV